jgi:hypothetical protein
MAGRRSGAVRGRGTGRASVVLVYGESRFDTSAIGELIEAMAPGWERRVQARRDPPIEVKNAKLKDLPRRSDRLAGALATEKVAREVACVFAHEDCDDFEPAHRSLTARIESALGQLDVPVFAVTPAWETEAWWFMWPDAVAAVQSTWREPDDYAGRDVGLIRDAKEELQKAVVPKGLNRAQKSKFRSYQETDAPAIARSVRERGDVLSPKAKSESFDYFAARVKASCVHS